MIGRSLRIALFGVATAAVLAGCKVKDAKEPAEPAANAAAAVPAASAEAPLAKAAADPSLQWGACAPFFPAGCEVAVLHGDPAKPNADVFLRAPAGYVIPPHTHTSEERMVLVSGTLKVKYQGHPEATLQAGHYGYGPAGVPHSGTCAAGAPCVLFIAFEGPVDVHPFEGEL